MMTENIKLGEGVYNISDLSNILGVTPRSARYLFNKYVREVFPSITNFRYNFETETGLFVNFKSLLQFYVFLELKNRGHSNKKILSMYKFISEKYKTKYPFAKKDIFSVGSEILTNHHGQLINQTLQLSMTEILEKYIHKIEFGQDGYAEKYFPLGKDKSIVVDPKIQFGSPTIKGTRVEIKTIKESFDSGDPKELIAKIYDLTMNQVEDAISFNQAA